MIVSTTWPLLVSTARASPHNLLREDKIMGNTYLTGVAKKASSDPEVEMMVDGMMLGRGTRQQKEHCQRLLYTKRDGASKGCSVSDEDDGCEFWIWKRLYQLRTVICSR